MKFDLTKALLLIIAVFCGNLTFAAPNPPAPIPPPPPGLPVDEGVVFLVMSCFVYAFYKIKNNKKASSIS
jgi:hypothetical protein